MGKRKSLSEQLHGMFEPAPEFVLEDEMDEGPALIASDEDGLEHEFQQPSSEPRRIGLKGGIEMEGVEYSGVKSSRAAIFGDHDQGAVDCMDLGDNALSLHELEDVRQSSDSEETDLKKTMSIHKKMGSSKIRSGSQESDDIPSDNLSDMDGEYNDMHQADPCGIGALRMRLQSDREKGLAVKRQKLCWDNWLSIRILLQKCLTSTNLIGQELNASGEFSSTTDMKTMLKPLASEAYPLLHELMSLQSAVLGCSPHVTQKDVSDVGDASSIEDMWTVIDGRYEAFSDYRDIALDRYHRQVMLQSGAVQRSNLKILHQGISAQVAAQLRAPHRLIARSQLPLKQTVDGTSSHNATSQDHPTEIQESLRDQETYDDSQFYQQLLKEYLENKGFGSVAVDSAVKKHKQKASIRGHQRCKGRALKYTVHEKLVNFMTPVEVEPSPISAQLFQNLFGHRG